MNWEMRLWIFFIGGIFFLWLGNFTDTYRRGLRVGIPEWMCKLLFLREDKKKKLLVVIIYQVYAEIMILIHGIRFFMIEHVEFVRNCKIFYVHAAWGAVACAAICVGTDVIREMREKRC